MTGKEASEKVTEMKMQKENKPDRRSIIKELLDRWRQKNNPERKLTPKNIMPAKQTNAARDKA